MLEFSDVAVAHAIQLAVAPVFLLSGIGAILAVMTNRLGRVIDRGRVLEDRLGAASPKLVTTLRADLAILSRRAKLNQPCHHPLHHDSAARLHGYRGLVPERLFTLRCGNSRGVAVCPGDGVFLSWPANVSPGDLRSDREPSYRISLSLSATLTRRKGRR